jgi:NAD-dependent deacetylase
VPLIEEAAEIVAEADVFVVVGTSLQVYPAAGLVGEVSPGVSVYIVDPGNPAVSGSSNLTFIQEKATTGMQRLRELLLGTTN